MGVAGSNPATPTICFTKPFKRLVNFLNLRKNMKTTPLAQFWHSEIDHWQHCGGEGRDGRFKVDLKAERQSLVRSVSKREALVWPREQELEARPRTHGTLRGIMVADIVSRYRDEVVPQKRGADRETLTLNAFLRHPRPAWLSVMSPLAW